MVKIRSVPSDRPVSKNTSASSRESPGYRRNPPDASKDAPASSKVYRITTDRFNDHTIIEETATPMGGYRTVTGKPIPFNPNSKKMRRALMGYISTPEPDYQTRPYRRGLSCDQSLPYGQRRKPQVSVYRDPPCSHPRYPVSTHDDFGSSGPNLAARCPDCVARRNRSSGCRNCDRMSAGPSRSEVPAQNFYNPRRSWDSVDYSNEPSWLDDGPMEALQASRNSSSQAHYRSKPVYYESQPAFYESKPAFYESKPAYYERNSDYSESKPTFYERTPAYYEGQSNPYPCEASQPRVYQSSAAWQPPEEEHFVGDPFAGQHLVQRGVSFQNAARVCDFSPPRQQQAAPLNLDHHNSNCFRPLESVTYITGPTGGLGESRGPASWRPRSPPVGKTCRSRQELWQEQSSQTDAGGDPSDCDPWHEPFVDAMTSVSPRNHSHSHCSSPTTPRPLVSYRKASPETDKYGKCAIPSVVFVCDQSNKPSPSRQTKTTVFLCDTSKTLPGNEDACDQCCNTDEPPPGPNHFIIGSQEDLAPASDNRMSRHNMTVAVPPTRFQTNEGLCCRKTAQPTNPCQALMIKTFQPYQDDGWTCTEEHPYLEVCCCFRSLLHCVARILFTVIALTILLMLLLVFICVNSLAHNVALVAIILMLYILLLSPGHLYLSSLFK